MVYPTDKAQVSFAKIVGLLCAACREARVPKVDLKTFVRALRANVRSLGLALRANDSTIKTAEKLASSQRDHFNLRSKNATRA